MERSPSAISMPRNHSSTALGDLNGEHKVGLGGSGVGPFLEEANNFPGEWRSVTPLAVISN